MEDLYYLHCLNLFPKFGPKRLSLLANYFPDYATAWQAPSSELILAGLNVELAAEFKAFANTISPEAEQTKLEQQNIKLISQKSEDYPELLRESDLPPVVLYYKGKLPKSEAVLLAAVGTRKISPYGRAVVPRLLGPLIDAGIVLVSGLAYGVDAAVHSEVVARGKSTIAILGSGLDEAALYPKEHALLASRIVDTGGCLLSEYPPGTPGFKQNFIARNRIIAGISIGTVIVECDLKSGSLITAQYALDQNRRVYAVPGPIYSAESRGPNNLIKMGAQLVTESNDILNDLNIVPQSQLDEIPKADNPAEGIVLGILSSNPLSADELIQRSGLDAALLTTTLTFLEMKGRIKNLGAQQYIRSR